MTCYVELIKIKQDICSVHSQLKELSNNHSNNKGQDIISELDVINEKIKVIRSRMQIYETFKFDYDAKYPTTN